MGALIPTILGHAAGEVLLEKGQSTWDWIGASPGYGLLAACNFVLAFVQDKACGLCGCGPEPKPVEIDEATGKPVENKAWMWDMFHSLKWALLGTATYFTAVKWVPMNGYMIGAVFGSAFAGMFLLDYNNWLGLLGDEKPQVIPEPAKPPSKPPQKPKRPSKKKRKAEAKTNNETYALWAVLAICLCVALFIVGRLLFYKGSSDSDKDEEPAYDIENPAPVDPVV